MPMALVSENSILGLQDWYLLTLNIELGTITREKLAADGLDGGNCHRGGAATESGSEPQ